MAPLGARQAGGSAPRKTSIRGSNHGHQRLERAVATQAAAAAAAASGPAALSAAEAARRFPVVELRQQCAEIRGRVAAEHLPGGLIYVAGAEQVLRNGADVYFPFRQSSDFAYLTGLSEPGFALVLDTEAACSSSGSRGLTLVAPAFDDAAAVWSGELPSLEQMAEQAGADRCIYASDLAAHLSERHRDEEIHTLPGRCEDLLEAAAVQNRVSSVFLPNRLATCRTVKTDAEVACLLYANQVSGEAHQALWRNCQPGQYEYQLAAAFAHSTMSQGLEHLGYPSIVGAGGNAAILHYCRNAAQLQPGQLVLVDAGAEFRCYTADITRTFPVSGHFSAAQRDIYDAVLAVQEEGLGRLQPGALMSDIENSCRRQLLAALLDLGLIKDSVEAGLQHQVDRVFMPHGLSHFLGLDVHDVSATGPVPKSKLQPGHCVTIEPGIYFMPQLLQRAAAVPAKAALINFERVEQMQSVGGVRIEDNVALLPHGALNLTVAAGVPKSALEIEEVIRGGLRG